MKQKIKNFFFGLLIIIIYLWCQPPVDAQTINGLYTPPPVSVWDLN